MSRLTEWAWKYTLKHNKDAIIEYNRIKENNPVTHKDLIYAFTVAKKRHFRFEDAVHLPKDRFDKLQEYLTYMSAGLTSQELNKLLDVAEQCVEDGIVYKNEKGKYPNAMKLVNILYEIRNRQNIIAPAELSYNYLAVQYVREDENPVVFNNEIHMEKVQAFKDAAETSSSFFFSSARISESVDLVTHIQEEMEAILQKVGGGKRQAKDTYRHLFIQKRIISQRENIADQLMTICEGDLVQYEKIKQGRISDYLIKLSNFVTSREVK